MKVRFVSHCLLAAGILVGTEAIGQSFPQKPVRVIIPFPPGGATDLVVRMVQPRLTASLGQPVVVENRAGANGVIGADLTAHATPDGYTLMYTTGPSLMLARHLFRSVPYDALRDFTPVALAVESISAIAVHPSLPVSSVKELLDYARRNPGRLAYGTPGVASAFHLAAEYLKHETGLDMVHVPFKGSGPSMNALVAGQIPIAISNLGTALPFQKQGKVRVIALTQSHRFSRLPDVPTVGESVPGFEMPSGWFGFLGPAGVPAAAVARLNRDINAVVNRPDVRNRIEDASMEVVTGPPEQLTAALRKSDALFGRIVEITHIKPEH
jgi:tripartite-type tricarboxylate transporter receptor subunit TctC